MPQPQLFLSQSSEQALCPLFPPSALLLSSAFPVPLRTHGLATLSLNHSLIPFSLRSSLRITGQNPDPATMWLPTFSSYNRLLMATVKTPLSPQVGSQLGPHTFLTILSPDLVAASSLPLLLPQLFQASSNVFKPLSASPPLGDYMPPPSQLLGIHPADLKGKESRLGSCIGDYRSITSIRKPTVLPLLSSPLTATSPSYE